jgi:hypothetical protein
MKRTIGASVALVAAIAVVAVAYQPEQVEASDHDDGETDFKARALNLTDHFAFKSPAAPDELALVMYFNPRSLPGRQYFMSSNARYELHVSKVAARADAPTAKEDFIFRFEAGAPDATGVQAVKLTILKDGAEVGSATGNTTDFASSKAGTLTTNSSTTGGLDVKWFIGQRADSFHFDVVRFFQVRTFLADRFFGGTAPNTGNAAATLAENCRGDAFLGAEAGLPDHDAINLFNPPSCAPDFTKSLNVTAIVLNVKTAQLGGTIFDTWSTISVLQ